MTALIKFTNSLSLFIAFVISALVVIWISTSPAVIGIGGMMFMFGMVAGLAAATFGVFVADLIEATEIQPQEETA